MCTLVSMNPGVTNLPVPSITVAPAGTVTDPRGPISAIRLSRTTMVAFDSGAPPLPSMIVAPTTATTPVCCCASTAVRLTNPPATTVTTPASSRNGRDIRFDMITTCLFRNVRLRRTDAQRLARDLDDADWRRQPLAVRRRLLDLADDIETANDAAERGDPLSIRISLPAEIERRQIVQADEEIGARGVRATSRHRHGAGDVPNAGLFCPFERNGWERLFAPFRVDSTLNDFDRMCLRLLVVRPHGAV